MNFFIMRLFYRSHFSFLESCTRFLTQSIRKIKISSALIDFYSLNDVKLYLHHGFSIGNWYTLPLGIAWA